MADGVVAGKPVAVMTGATSGIGEWIALGLARLGRHVVLVGRDAVRAQRTADWIAAEAPGASVETMLADLRFLRAARELGAAVAARHPRVSVLVNNAGLFRPRRELTAEGRETVLAVNHLAPWVLARALEGALRAGAAANGEARLVNVGSSASDRARIVPDDLDGARRWSTLGAYGQSKLAMMMATFEWARRWDGSGVTANVVHPGLVATRIGELPGLVGLGWKLAAPLMLSPRQGAATPLHVAAAAELAGVTGRYWKRKREAAPNPRARDAALRQAVWAATERLADVG